MVVGVATGKTVALGAGKVGAVSGAVTLSRALNAFQSKLAPLSASVSPVLLIPELSKASACGEYRYQGGWNVNALIATGVGAVFSSLLPNLTNLLPPWWGTYGWFFGVAIGGVVYYALAMVHPRAMPVARAKA